jgi:hypothetical protein
LIPDCRIKKRVSPMRTKETIQIGENTDDGGERTGCMRPLYHAGIPGRAGYHPI